MAAAQEGGESSWKRIFYNIVPNQISLVAASFVSAVLYAIGALAGVDFLGIDNTSTWSLGAIRYWAQNGHALELRAWWFPVLGRPRGSSCWPRLGLDGCFSGPMQLRGIGGS